ncbi:hypothetical protein [Pseudarthrobacter sp. efr-133-R2A-89]|uniref:hypothetical protein n=1 Tax=Pseudarthrobacter sp. efr-133-R2A-89 TaxID=3040302 RepID=UPI002555DE02|nr:hypothetical protein [Pseudarthrobacter sp. efr-133-R2A-89]
MNQGRMQKRMLRRETHSSRTGLSVASAVLLLAGFLWLGTECVLALLGRGPLVASPDAMATAVRDLPQAVQPAVMTAAGAAAAVLGAALLVAAVKGGRRGRRAMHSERLALVVDDEAIAAAVSRQVRLAANLAPEQVSTTVGRRRAHVSVRPTSGQPLDREVLTEAAAREVASCRLARNLAADVTIAAEGAVGQ